ncbi:MAG: TRAP-type C4-dicarboxylate transport system, small permease component [Rhodobacteraceae bacterium HLUCCO07]|nr:MAG: TRAP-type C4-dicarboxylate transport system, small permease component [Rhodobacteraceae bacterium HLUCCO07]
MFMIGRALSHLAKFASLIGAICVVLMMLHVTADVLGRYLFNAPVPGTIVVVANYYMVFVAFIALGVAEEKRAHISVEILTDLMPPRPRNVLSVFSGVLTVAVLVVVMIGGYTEAVSKTRGGATMEQGSQLVEIWQSFWFVPVGAALMALIAAYRVIATVTGAQNGLSETDTDVKFIND